MKSSAFSKPKASKKPLETITELVGLSENQTSDEDMDREEDTQRDTKLTAPLFFFNEQKKTQKLMSGAQASFWLLLYCNSVNHLPSAKSASFALNRSEEQVSRSSSSRPNVFLAQRKAAYAEGRKNAKEVVQAGITTLYMRSITAYICSLMSKLNKKGRHPSSVGGLTRPRTRTPKASRRLFCAITYSQGQI